MLLEPGERDRDWLALDLQAILLGPIQNEGGILD
jgi:hypothetical protein